MITVFHVTVLSNFARAFDKYSKSYDKSKISESTYPGRFFVLHFDELSIGINKANKLIEKLKIDGNRPIILKTRIDPSSLLRDHPSGLGQYFKGDSLLVEGILYGDTLEETTVEEVYAASLSVNGSLVPYNALKPRTLSILPVARACQASCLFCFSESSASFDQKKSNVDFEALNKACQKAKAAGAERFVITGGGEPTLLKEETLLEVMRTARKYFDKVVLITNGFNIGKESSESAKALLRRYSDAGLTTLAVSYHHFNPDANLRIMGIETNIEKVMRAWNEVRDETSLKMRLICVLQKNGIDDKLKLYRYLCWAEIHEITEVCFKELYVSSTLESQYADHKENQWCRENQVSLSLVTDSLHEFGFEKDSELPWGAPIYKKPSWFGEMKVAAYTEPSMFWERSNGICRSWNIMTDGTVLASLEDPNSKVNI